jgi:hypothetical protein
MAASTGVPAEEIDGLLERYLGLLDEYTKLRSRLSEMQTSVYQNIARANFSAERGIRYGQELYDERMQASRSLVITAGEDDTPVFETQFSGEVKMETSADNQSTGTDSEETDAEGGDEKGGVGQQKKMKDPLRWFGILTPMPLRQAQRTSIEAVEHVIPRLVTLSAQMADVEIRVRRVRKKRTKAEAAAGKMQALADEASATEEEAADGSHQESDGIAQKLAALHVQEEGRGAAVTV